MHMFLLVLNILLCVTHQPPWWYLSEGFLVIPIIIASISFIIVNVVSLLLKCDISANLAVLFFPIPIYAVAVVVTCTMHFFIYFSSGMGVKGVDHIIWMLFSYSEWNIWTIWGFSFNNLYIWCDNYAIIVARWWPYNWLRSMIVPLILVARILLSAWNF